MKKIQLTISAALFSALALDATATPEQIEAGLPGLIARADKSTQLEIDKVNLARERDDFKKKFEELTKETANAENTALLNKAEEDKLITPALKAQLAKDYEGKPEGLKIVLAAIKPSSVVNLIKETDAATKAKYANLSWDEIGEKGLMESFKADCREEYKALYKKTFNGAEPPATA